MIYIQYPLNFGALIFLPPPTGGKLNPPSFLFSLLSAIWYVRNICMLYCFQFVPFVV